MVYLTKIYTKTGDKGETSIANNKRVKKNSPLIIAIGAVDEANSAIGMIPKDGNHEIFDQIQNNLFDLGADLAESKTIKITKDYIDTLELYIDGTNSLLKPLDSFVLPTGPIHFARTVVRRAEIQVLLAMDYEDINPLIAIYLNRLSDLLFVLARYYNNTNEKLWKPTNFPAPL